MNTQNEAARRAYWTQQMDEAFDFMQRMRDYSVEECGETLVSLRASVADAKVGVLFSDSKIALDLERVFYLRAGLIDGFIGAARAMNVRGWTMKVEDGFRSVEMQTLLGRKPEVFDAILKSAMWECDGVPSPELLFKRVSALVATRPKIGTHMSGSAVDISVFDEDGNEIDRGAPYLEMSEKTPMTSPFVSDAARENRDAIRQIMEQSGLIAYPFEFWHFDGGDCYAEYLTGSQKPARYGAIDFDEARGTVTPLENPQQVLQDDETLHGLIEQSLRRQNLQRQNT